MRRRFSFHLLGPACVITVACATVPTPPPAAGAQEATGAPVIVSRCGATLGSSPFLNPDATHVLVADFYGLQPSDTQFAQSVSSQVSAELRRFEEEELPNFPVHVPKDSLELRRLSCFIDSHAEAEAIAAAWGADLVVWGKAYCNPLPDRYVQVHNDVRVGVSVTASGHAQQSVGTVNVEAPEAYTVCPSATLHARDATLRRTSKPIDVTGLGHLDLPTLSSTEPFQLVDFALGLHFYERDLPWVAAHFFKRSVEHVMTRHDARSAPLYGYLARSYLELSHGHEQAIAYANQALELAEAGTQAEAFLLTTIGAALYGQGKYSEAEQYARWALALEEKDLGPDHPDVGLVISNIGAALHGQGKYSEAEQYARRALALLEKARGPDHPDVATAISDVGGALLAQGKHDEAEQNLRRALAIKEKALGPDHPDVGLVISNIGAALYGQGKHDAAEQNLRRALAIQAKALGPDHPRTAVVRANLGVVVKAADHPAAALSGSSMP